MNFMLKAIPAFSTTAEQNGTAILPQKKHPDILETVAQNVNNLSERNG
jgi:hypothetical protein